MNDIIKAEDACLASLKAKNKEMYEEVSKILCDISKNINEAVSSGLYLALSDVTGMRSVDIVEQILRKKGYRVRVGWERSADDGWDLKDWLTVSWDSDSIDIYDIRKTVDRIINKLSEI